MLEKTDCLNSDTFPADDGTFPNCERICMDGSQQLVSEFLGSHPEYIADVRWMNVGGGRRELMMSAEATKAFADWAQRNKGAHPDKVTKQKA